MAAKYIEQGKKLKAAADKYNMLSTEKLDGISSLLDPAMPSVPDHNELVSVISPWEVDPNAKIIFIENKFSKIKNAGFTKQLCDEINEKGNRQGVYCYASMRNPTETLNKESERYSLFKKATVFVKF